jgi:hypothetical protein
MLGVSLCIITFAVLGQSTEAALREAGRLSDPRIKEASALEQSLRFPGVYWTVSDSGNPAHLYAVDRVGKVLATYSVTGAVNLDWECLAIDKQGRLFICDVGNNEIDGASRLPQRWVYMVQEPDPREAPPSDALEPLPLPLERTLVIRYPGGRPFDIEAAFAWGDAVYFISKTHSDEAIYRLLLAADAKKSDYDSEAHTLEKVADLPGLQRATGAALSSDGRRLAVCTYREVVLYDVMQGDTFALAAGRPSRRIPFRALQVEACSWDGPNVLLLNELGNLFRLPAR